MTNDFRMLGRIPLAMLAIVPHEPRRMDSSRCTSSTNYDGSKHLDAL